MFYVHIFAIRKRSAWCRSVLRLTLYFLLRSSRMLLYTIFNPKFMAISDCTPFLSGIVYYFLEIIFNFLKLFERFQTCVVPILSVVLETLR